MKPCTTTIVVLFMAVVSASLTSARPGEDTGPVNCNCSLPHEVWTDCGPGIPECVPWCGEPVIGRPCPTNCVAQCVCEEGFIRKIRGGPCIRPCACPPIDN